MKDKDLPALRERIKTILKETLGLARFEEDEEGDFLCHYEAMPFNVVFHDDDASFVWIHTYPYWFKDCAETPRDVVDYCINHVNCRCKGVKLARMIEPDHEGDYAVAASVSFLVDDPASLTEETLERYLTMLKHGGRELHAQLEAHTMRESKAPRTRANAPAVRH